MWEVLCNCEIINMWYVLGLWNSNITDMCMCHVVGLCYSGIIDKLCDM